MTSESAHPAPMRRTEREVTAPAEVEQMLAQGTVCHLGLVDGDRAYVVPVSYGYQEGRLYVHSAGMGHKVELLRANNNVCFEVTVESSVVPAGSPCSWSVRYASVIGYGRASFIDDRAEKARALDVITGHYGGGEGHDYPAESLDRVTVIAIAVESLTGKRSAPGGE